MPLDEDKYKNMTLIQFFDYTNAGVFILIVLGIGLLVVAPISFFLWYSMTNAANACSHFTLYPDGRKECFNGNNNGIN